MSGENTDNLKMSKLTDLTGGGLIIAKDLASNGAKVYISGRRFEVLKKAAELKFDGEGEIIPLRMDVTDKSNILVVIDIIKDTDGKLDVIVNSAGTDGPKTRANFVNASSLSEDQTLGAYGRELFNMQSFED
ncbi:hypothetical protein EW145_g6390 [Phellinidium pouzarii]|uniref:Ketoreductase (KR) domain-containing protein n=1 Tax=Phellinidium pouzarii TaxID=167371 RepID=A0A4S4L1G0_9AGAM|nr:hypothetical protein EW145_g6390 [Phellinidium pouzarii]